MIIIVRLKKYLMPLGIIFTLLGAACIVHAFRVAIPEAKPVAAPVQQRMLIIDAGHGGEDGGAQSAEGVLESGINLRIAQKLEALAGLFGERTVMTRASDDIAYPDSAVTTAQRKRADQKARVELINSYPNAVLISIHQNFYPDVRPSGSQALYAHNDDSEVLGKLMHEMLRAELCPDNRRVAAPISDSIYLMKSVTCTAVLVECGFLSNAAEAELLNSDEYQIKLSAVLLASYMQFVGERDGMET